MKMVAAMRRTFGSMIYNTIPYTGLSALGPIGQNGDTVPSSSNITQLASLECASHS